MTKTKQALEWLKQHPEKSVNEAAQEFKMSSAAIYAALKKARGADATAKKKIAPKAVSTKKRPSTLPEEMRQPALFAIREPAVEAESTVIIIKTKNLRDTLRDFL